MVVTEVELFAEQAKDNEPEERLVKQVLGLFKRAQKRKKDRQDKWDKFHKLYKGEGHWPTGRAWYKSNSVANYCFSNVETVLPWLTEGRVRGAVMPRESSDVDAARALEQLLDRFHTERNLDQKVQQVVKMGLKYGDAAFKVCWNPCIEGPGPFGMGDVDVEAISPLHIFPDPDASCIEKAQFIIHAEPRDLGYIRKHYPEQGWRVKPEKRYSELGDYETDGAGTAEDPISADYNKDYGTSGTLKSDYGLLTKRALLIECWIRDDSVEVVLDDNGEPEIDEYGNQKTEQLYPTGRKIVIANGILLQDIPNPYKRFPFVMFRDYHDDRSFWSMGEIDQIEPLQTDVNEMRGMIIDNAHHMDNGVWIIDDESGVDPFSITDQPGQIIVKQQGSEVRREQGVPLPNEVFNFLNDTKTVIESVSGIYDVTQGRRPTGITAAAAIAELQEAAQARIRLKARNLEMALREVYRMALDLMLQYYDPEGTVRIVLPNDTPQLPGMGETLSVGNERIAFMKLMWLADVQSRDRRFDFNIEAGSSIPISKVQRYNEAIQLYRLGAIDRRGLLEVINYPQREQILARMEVTEQAAQMATQPPTASGAPAGPPPPAGVTPDDLASIADQLPPEIQAMLMSGDEATVAQGIAAIQQMGR